MGEHFWNTKGRQTDALDPPSSENSTRTPQSLTRKEMVSKHTEREYRESPAGPAKPSWQVAEGTCSPLQLTT